MSDGASDANREEREMRAIARAADDLAASLRATGDAAFFKVHANAIAIANEYLKRTGYQLTKEKGT